MNKRSFLKASASIVTGATLLPGTKLMAKTHEKPIFVFIHGAWHGAWTWNEITPRLAKSGYASVAIDLPGAGSQARFPQAFLDRSLDRGALLTERSPNAAVTQDQRTEAAVDAVKAAAALGNGKVVLVGHSLGGLTISRVAEAVPELIESIVYLCAFFLPNGMSMVQFRADPSFSSGKTGSLYLGDPKSIGALRLDTRSEDPDYTSSLKQAFYADIDDTQFFAVANMMHSDEPASVAGVPMSISAERFGTVERHYIRMGDDNAIPPEAQDAMIKLVDGSGIGGKTIVHRLSGSHSPFYAKPDALLDVFAKIVK